jgi:hypothetical protein
MKKGLIKIIAASTVATLSLSGCTTTGIKESDNQGITIETTESITNSTTAETTSTGEIEENTVDHLSAVKQTIEESNIEQVEDTLQPHSEGLEKVLNGLDENFRSSIFGNTGGKTDELVKQYINGKKRNRSKSEDSLSDKGNKKNKNKKKKDISEDESDEKEEMGNYYSDEVIRKMMDNQKLKKMNVQELKDICRIRNISTKNLKKFEILEKIKIYLKEIDD